LGISFLYNVLDMIEVLIGAFLLRRRSAQLPRFTDGAYLLRFAAYAVVAGPLAAGSILALIATVAWHQAAFPVVVTWLIADGIGISVACPICVAILQTHFRYAPHLRRDWVYLVVVIGVTIGVFGQSNAPLQFLIYPVLIQVLLRLGLGWAASSLLFVAFAGGWFTVHGSGPVAAAALLSWQNCSLLFQVFIACGMLMLYSVTVLLESRRAIERRLEKTASLHNLVTENSHDIIMFADFDGRPHYISPAVHSMTGWTPEEAMNRRFADVIHPEDLPKIVESIGKLQEGSEAATIQYRMAKRSGGYFWVEGSFRAIRDPGTGVRIGVLLIVRDISERKETEKLLQDAYSAVEALAITDSLTGLANRRQFDQALAREWRRGMRDGNPLSLLMIDADFFKSYNDAYGHLRGDNCLIQIAEAAHASVTRPEDLVARIGGEEFAIILPNTSNEGARHVANEICEALRGRGIHHEGNPAGIMSVSIGCATLIPLIGQDSAVLVELADENLYKAKRNGRNCVCSDQSASDAIDGAESFAPDDISAGKAPGAVPGLV
jgi:diguanylate cyclase (GGDEF)-like protein/PAS domain S-box-containing protein